MTSRCYARRFLRDHSFANFAENFVKIQSLQAIILNDYDLVREPVVLARLDVSLKTQLDLLAKLQRKCCDQLQVVLI